MQRQARVLVGGRGLRRPALAHGVVALAFAGGIGVRLWFVAAYRPAFLGHIDAAGYLGAARRDLFADPLHPAGYAVFLRVAHVLSAHLSATILLQHALGVLTAGLLFASVRGLSRSPWVALAPAVVVLFDGLQVWLEHAVLSETLFTLLLVAGVAAGLRSLDAHHRSRWLIVASLLLVGSGLVRSVGVAAIPVLAACAVLTSGERRRRALLAAALPGVALVLAYGVVQLSVTGAFGLGREPGRVAYSRVAPFADCSRLAAPAGTEGLCEASPARTRQGTNYYLWDPRSPAWRRFGPGPQGDGSLRGFARAALLAQPLDYLGSVTRDVAGQVGLKGDARFMAGATIQLYVRLVDADVVSYYRTGPGTSAADPGPLAVYARTVEVHGALAWVLLVLALASPLALAGRERSGALLLAATGLVEIVAPVALANPDPRYAVPTLGLLAAAAALGVRSLVVRVRSRGLPGLGSAAPEVVA